MDHSNIPYLLNYYIQDLHLTKVQLDHYPDLFEIRKIYNEICPYQNEDILNNMKKYLNTIYVNCSLEWAYELDLHLVLNMSGE